MAPDATAWYALVLLGAAAVFWTWRSGDRQVETLRILARKLEKIGGRILAADSRRDILDVLEQDLPPILGTVSWRLYFYERSRRTLEADNDIVQVHAPEEGEPAAIALAFRHRVRSTRHAPRAGETTHFLPCGLGEEVHGVLLLRGAGDADGATLNYLSTQIGAALAHLEHAAGRNLDARSEKRQAVSEVLTRVIAEIEQRDEFPALVDRLRAMMREEDRTIAAADAYATGGTVRTTLLLEPDLASRRSLLAALGDRGIRALPANTVDEAADWLERIQFDVVFCSARLAEGGWLDIANRLGRRARLIWLADAQSLRWVDGSGIAVLESAAGLDAIVSA